MKKVMKLKAPKPIKVKQTFSNHKKEDLSAPKKEKALYGKPSKPIKTKKFKK